MDNRQQIIANFEQIRALLISTLLMLNDENKEGKQYDYCTSPKLSDTFDAANRTMEKIEKIIYQE